MKTLTLILALAMSTSAFAQTPPADTMPPGEPMETPMPDESMTPPDESMEPTEPMQPTEPMAEQMPMPAPGMAPMSGMKRVQPGPSVNQAFPPPPPRTDYPFCSRTVTDSCVQRNDPGGNAPR